MGKVVALNKEGAWVDIGFKSEGLIPPVEMKSRAKRPLEEGEEVLVLVLQPRNADGQVILSLDRARKFVTWYRLERFLSSGEPIEAVVISANRGGLIVRYEGVQGFIPLSQIDGSNRRTDRRAWLETKIGKRLKLKVIEVNKQQGRLILSHKAVVEEERERLLSLLVEGQIIKGKVTGVFNFGCFVDIGGMEGLVPTSELCWERGKTAQEVVKEGQEVDVYVLKVDIIEKRLILSLKRAGPHPWDNILDRYQVGQKIMGTVSRLFPFGAIVRLDSCIEGLAHISELASRRLSHPKEVVKVGQVLPFKILSIEPEKRQLRLSLKQAAEEG